MTTDERFEAMGSAFWLAARQAYLQLQNCGAASFELSPGDATNYVFIITPRPTVMVVGWPEEQRAEVQYTDRRDAYIVTLTMGYSYPWNGQQVHRDYCAVKWARNEHEWTGRVVASVLNQLSEMLKEDEGA